MSAAILNSCKSCGCTEPAIEESAGWAYPFAYTCPVCGESTLHHVTEEQARAAWNKKNERSPMYAVETA
jgi:hypothetical protein